MPAPSQLAASAVPRRKFSEWVIAYEQTYPNATAEDLLKYINSRPWQTQQQIPALAPSPTVPDSDSERFSAYLTPLTFKDASEASKEDGYIASLGT